MQHYIDRLHDTRGNAISGATINVYAAGTTTAATIYSDNGATVKANPTTSDTNGTFHFYAGNARYDLVITHSRYTFNNEHTQGISLFDGVVSGGGGYRSLASYGVNPSLTVNQTTAIQAAINADPGPLFIPTGAYLFDQLKISRKNGILGAGIGPMRVTQFGGTHLIQASGLNVHAIVTDEAECPPATEWFHWCRLENFVLTKLVGSSDTIGNGIHISQRIGEGMRCENVEVDGFPGHGIAAMNGSTPLNWSNIRAFMNGKAGVYLYSGGGSGVWDICALNHVSGDGNGWNDPDTNSTCLIRIHGGGQPRDVVQLRNVKSETRDAQLNAIHLQENNGTHFDIGPVTHLGLGTDFVGACVRITGTGGSNSLGRVTLHNVRGSGGSGTPMVMLKDVGNNNEYALNIDKQFFIYSWKDALVAPFDPSNQLPYNNAKFTSINVTTGTLEAMVLTGAKVVSVLSTNALPGDQTTRTATQMFGEYSNAAIGDAYTLIISNTGAGTFTLVAGAGVTLTGTMTIPVNTSRTFIVTFTSGTALVIQSVSTGGV